jgi:hypothetical protein
MSQVWMKAGAVGLLTWYRIMALECLALRMQSNW